MKYVTQETVDRLKLGNEEAFNEIYKHYRNIVFYMAITYFKNDATAEDIVQEVFIELNKHLDKIESPQVLTVWINKIAYTKCMAILRQKRVQTSTYDEMETLQDTSVDSDILDVINRKQINELIKKSILELDYDLQIVGLLRFYEELSIKDIADILVIPEGTVKSRIHTVKGHLRNKLKNNGIIKPYSIIPFLPLNMKSIYTQIVGGISPVKPVVITIKSMLLLSIASVILTSGVVFIKETKQSQPKTMITVDTKYTNASIPINIESNQDYDYYLIDGVKIENIQENGKHTVTLIKDNQEVYKQAFTVNNIDKDIPVLKNYKKENNKVYMYVEDSLSGINAGTIRGTTNGNKIDSITYDKDNQCISFEIKKEEQYIINLDDYAGNTLEINVSLGEE